MTKIYVYLITYCTSKRWAIVVVLAFVHINGLAQGLYATTELTTPRTNKTLFRSEDTSFSQPSASKLYSLYGNDFAGDSDFYISFYLESPQAIRYDLSDVTGKRLASGELSGVINQTFRIQVMDVSTGIYILRLAIDHQYFVEKLYVDP